MLQTHFKRYLEDILKNLEKSKYSLSLDTSTMTGQSLCVIKARYLKENLENNFTEELMDKSVAITTLKEAQQEKRWRKIKGRGFS